MRLKNKTNNVQLQFCQCRFSVSLCLVNFREYIFYSICGVRCVCWEMTNTAVWQYTAELNGATIFSKVELDSWYHQLVLHPYCRYISTFSTHMGLYRYKRLIFCVNAAAEVCLRGQFGLCFGIKGEKNICEDIIFHGKEEEEHYQALVETVKKLYQYDLPAISCKKCEFKIRKIKYYGRIFTQEGVSPGPENV